MIFRGWRFAPTAEYQKTVRYPAAAGKNTERISIINEIYPHFVEIVEEEHNICRMRINAFVVRDAISYVIACPAITRRS